MGTSGGFVLCAAENVARTENTCFSTWLGPYLALFFTNGYFLLRRQLEMQHSQTVVSRVIHNLSPMWIASILLFPSIIAVSFLFDMILGLAQSLIANTYLQHWILDVTRMFEAFIYDQGGNPTDFYGRLSDPKYVAKNGLYGFQVICADLMLVCRCVFFAWIWSELIQCFRFTDYTSFGDALGGYVCYP